MSNTFTLVDNKHYRIVVHTDDVRILENGKLLAGVDYKLKTTRATKFQAKKLFKRRMLVIINALLRSYRGDNVSRNPTSN